jgi:hypothetical protein
LKAELAGSQEKLDVLKEEEKGWSKSLEENKKQAQQMDNLLETLRADEEKVKHRLEEAGQAAEKIANIEQEIADKKNEIKELNAQADSARSQMEALKQEQAELEQEKARRREDEMSALTRLKAKVRPQGLGAGTTPSVPPTAADNQIPEQPPAVDRPALAARPLSPLTSKPVEPAKHVGFFKTAPAHLKPASPFSVPQQAVLPIKEHPALLKPASPFSNPQARPGLAPKVAINPLGRMPLPVKPQTGLRPPVPPVAHRPAPLSPPRPSENPKGDVSFS